MISKPQNYYDSTCFIYHYKSTIQSAMTREELNFFVKIGKIWLKLFISIEFILFCLLFFNDSL